MDALLTRIITYMQARNYRIDTAPGEINIVYLEGLNPDGTRNRDRLDEWNDLRVVFDYPKPEGPPRLLHLAVATTEPGRTATFSAAAAARGGVARIAFGQHTAWRVGTHKSAGHPALVQRAPLLVHRDVDQNGIRTGDPITDDVTGLNQHGTGRGKRPSRVGNYSEGCLVGLEWAQHLEFMRLVRSDPRYVARPHFLFTSTIIPGDQLP